MNQTYLNSTKNTVLSLKPSRAIRLLLMVLFFAFFGNVNAANISSKSSGNWSSPSTWNGNVVPSSSDAVTINNTVTIDVNVTVQSVNVIGTLIEKTDIVFTVGSAMTPGAFNVGGTFSMGSGSDHSTLIVYGNFTNNGGTSFHKSDVIITGNLITPSSSTLQNNGNVIVGGNIIGTFDISGNGTGQIYAVNPNATVTITPSNIDNNVTPGTYPSGESNTLTSIVSTVIYGGNCSFTVSDIASNSFCSGSNAVFEVSTTGTSPTYVWQVNRNDGTGWVNLTNVAPHSGVFTASLTITGVTILMNKYKYRAIIKAGSPTSCTKNGNYGVLTVAANSWKGSTDTNWFTAANWSCNSVPNLSTDVIIPKVTNQPIINNINSISALANTITVESGSSLIVESNNTLKITDKLTNYGGTVTFEDSASLVQTNNVANIGSITYNRDTPPVINTDFTYWSSPVAGYKLGQLSPNTLVGMFYSFDAGIENWKQEYSTTTMNVGVGYLVRGPEPTGQTPPNYGSFSATFKGVPNNGTIPVSIGSTGNSLGTSNLIGNPYPSAIDANAFLSANSGVIDGTLYFWTHSTGRNNGQYNNDDYASYNGTGGVAGNGGEVPTGKIAAGQGFFATSIKAGNVIFTNEMRVAGGASGNNSQFFKTKNPKGKTADNLEKNRVWLNLTNTEGAFKQTLIGYVTDATNDFDNLFDGQSFDGNEFVDFYSVYQDKNLVIQGRALPFEETDEVQLGFRTTINGDFTINIDQVDGVLTNQAVFIEDKLTNTVFDLKAGNYTFNTVAGTFNDRFVLKYFNKTLGTENFDSLANKVLVSNANKQVKINSFAETMDKVIIYDLLGRQIYQKTDVNGNELLISNLVSSRQVLIVKTLLQNGQEVSNKIVY